MSRHPHVAVPFRKEGLPLTLENIKMTGDYSEAPQVFEAPPPGLSLDSSLIMVMVMTTDTSLDTYGGELLTNGISMNLESDIDPRPVIPVEFSIKKISDWSLFTSDIEIVGPDPPVLPLAQRLIFIRTEPFEIPLFIEASANERLTVTLSDDFSHLYDHRMTIRGLVA